MSKVYLEKISGKQIYDLSGNKTLGEIEIEHGAGDYQEVELHSGEGYRVTDGRIVKYEIKKEAQEVIEALKSSDAGSEEFKTALLTYLGIQ